MSRIADPLREFAASTELVPGMSLRRSRDTLLAIADQIDREHERRMDQGKTFGETARRFYEWRGTEKGQ